MQIRGERAENLTRSSTLLFYKMLSLLKVSLKAGFESFPFNVGPKTKLSFLGVLFLTILTSRGISQRVEEL